MILLFQCESSHACQSLAPLVQLKRKKQNSFKIIISFVFTSPVFLATKVAKWRRKAHILLPLACDLNLVITSEASRVVNSFSFMGIILFPYFNSTKGVKRTMTSGNSRIRSSISPIWLDCSIRVYLDFALRKHGKLNNLLPQFLLCLHKPTSWIDTYIDLCENRGWEFFSRSYVLLVFFFFFFQQVTCIQPHHWRLIPPPNYWAIKFRGTKVMLFS